MFRMLVRPLLFLVVGLFAYSVAWAISNGVPDGNGHPAVGALYIDFDGDGTITGDELLCSGSYVGRTKDGANDAFMTAGHCVAYAVANDITQMYVSFDTKAFDPYGPVGVIASVAFYFDPSFGHDIGNWFDFGIVLLPAGSVVGIPAGGAADGGISGYADPCRRDQAARCRVGGVRRGSDIQSATWPDRYVRRRSSHGQHQHQGAHQVVGEVQRKLRRHGRRWHVLRRFGLPAVHRRNAHGDFDHEYRRHPMPRHGVEYAARYGLRSPVLRPVHQPSVIS